MKKLLISMVFPMLCFSGSLEEAVNLIKMNKNEEAVIMLKEINSEKAKVLLSNIYITNNNKEEAFKILNELSSNGSLRADMTLGMIYEKEGDFKNSFLKYKKVADSGHFLGQSNLAGLYYHGKGVEKNIDMSIKYYTLAAEQNDKHSQFNLAYIYEHEKNDNINALKWYEKCSDKNVESFNNMGLIYLKGGGGIEKDLKKSKELFEKGKDLGDDMAIKN